MGGSKKVCWGLCACAFVYFVFFPGDIATLGEPFSELARAASKPAKTILELSNSVSPWLYGAVLSLVGAKTAMSVWGNDPKPAAKPATKRKASPKAG